MMIRSFVASSLAAVAMAALTACSSAEGAVDTTVSEVPSATVEQVATTSSALLSSSNTWRRSFTNEACTHICQRDGLEAVEAGVHVNGGRFYTCSAADGRPGYQLLGYANNQCAVGYGGKEIGYSTYYCLCTNSGGQTPIVD